MKKPNIIQTRIDARLLHGQASLWMQSNGCNLVVVADDKASVNEMQQDIMDTTVPDGVESRYFSIQKTIDVIHNASESQKIFLIVKDIDNLKKLIDGGVPINEVNIGNVHKKDNSQNYTSHINLTPDEENILLDLDKKNIVFTTNIMPTIDKGKIELIRTIKKKKKK